MNQPHSTTYSQEKQEFIEFWNTYGGAHDPVFRAVLFDPKTGACFVVERTYNRNRKDTEYRRRQAEHLVNQIAEEEIDSYCYVVTDAWRMIERQYDGVPNRRIHLGDKIVVISRLGNRKLPDETSARVKQVFDWLSEMPDDKKIGGSHGFGGKLAGSRPPSKFKLLHESPYRIVDQLKEDNRYWYEGENAFKIKAHKNCPKGREMEEVNQYCMIKGWLVS